MAPPGTARTITNLDFLRAITKGHEGKPWVASFEADPNGDAAKWYGKPVKRARDVPASGRNNYFSIATFRDPSAGRRKDNVVAVVAVVLDDVADDALDALPIAPSYVLETSPGKFHAGLALAPGQDPALVDGLYHALITKRLVSADRSGNNTVRYARLPDGTNSKAAVVEDVGAPFPCRLHDFSPDLRYDVAQLALAFGVDVAKIADSAPRPDPTPDDELRQLVMTGEAFHQPLVSLAARMVGRGMAGGDVGAALTTLMDAAAETIVPDRHARWKVERGQIGRYVAEAVAKYGDRRMATGTNGATVSDISAARKAKEAKAAKREHERGEARAKASDLVSRFVYVAEQDVVYDIEPGIFLTRSALDASYLAEFTTVRLSHALLTHPKRQIAHSVTWRPKKPPLIHEAPRVLLNTWRDDGLKPRVGNVRPWVEHCEYLIPNKRERERVWDWIAFTLQHQGCKVNYQLVLGGLGGIGKDTMLQPLIRGLGRSSVKQPQAHELNSEFNSYLDRAKLVVIQEIHSFQRKDIENKLKPVCAAPPDYLRINEKGLKSFEIPNLVSVVFMTNHRADALNVGEDDRRYFCVWSPAARMPADYYTELYRWMDAGGDRAVIAWLLERDLRNFKRGEPPPVTEWKVDLQGASAPATERTLRELMDEEREPFNRDIAAKKEMLASNPVLGKLEQHLDVALRNVGAVSQRLVFKLPGEQKATTRHVWILRNHERYADMPPAKIALDWFSAGGDRG